ncbi:MAG: glutamine--fructose-6-phosphate aminotransferase [Sulfurimonas sp. RIFOXYD12_FULL_33_39]|uniref:glutamine--fructose-6-phosphate transaminase (isomerizing) n=1 Tax=unclassified Sulfurimonas TaxID=2623549 RepID=UPI0008B9BC78|nr:MULTISPECIES: glutamine--fructose-6-phosphate transaminase (isomerizing) [unclassified Sulfurimonas]OHE09126.1 MAG: glutamine--fructose-6-phosphate aminotransferase [Sulfurimonas sp. RIFOXYD12_FULL_33_39]OHE14443.1 MAG: glutamine--fructose-6-phosphate aminotransferase [Sulfurimonas sp. RIFOXYD2_FULL_34_21]DAB28477.1 MAG TPA: glutamine--fructose-6-phosphate transaminase (isomerizing) [Sulfurimonas sp. UBA10385]
MCGIVGYLGKKNTKQILLDGLKELEYRGYDSAGIAVLQNGEFSNFKAVGKLVNLEEKTKDFKTDGFSVGIGHTRWATHGKPTELNAHPHLGESSYVVHNGIIENYATLKKELQSSGITFLSQTDTEVIVHQFEKNLKISNNPFEAFAKTVKELHGAYAILLVTKAEPNAIFFAKQGSPMLVGINAEDEKYFASSDTPIIGHCTNVNYFEDGDYGYITSSEIAIFDKDKKRKEPKFLTLLQNKLSAQKNGFRFFMEKEIYEQSDVISDTLMGRLSENEIIFDEIDKTLFDGISEIKLCACGTSYHSAMSASYLFERYSRIKTSLEIASEFRYREPVMSSDTLFIVISQSGETADTLEALKMAKASGLKTLVICNVDNSSMVRLADATILTRAGIEKGVASTKAFATQITVFWMLSLYIAKLKNSLEDNKIAKQISLLREIPSHVKVNDDLHERIKRLSKRYLHGHGFFFIGRDIFYPLALEGALKLKEISYLHAEGYPSGEMKHGPIALADPELFTIALLPKHLHYEKSKSNVEELSARDSTICAISQIEFEKADDFVQISECRDYMLEFFEMMIVVQLLSLEISIRLGNDVDMPRNLAKSVTVE